MNSGWVILIMVSLFLGLGYMGVPVAFAITAGVLAGAACTNISLASIVGELVVGVEKEALFAVPFFLLVGELMTSGHVTRHMIRLAQAIVGHMRGGLAQVVTVFSMFFAGISGSSTADVAVLARTVGPEMDKEGYDRPFTAALIASASTIANLIPPSIMAIVYGAYGDVSIGGLFLGGVVPGLIVGFGLMIYTHFYGPPGIKRPRATFGEFTDAAKASALTMMIPLIIMGGILTGRFTPTEAGVVAAAFIVFYIMPLNNRGLGAAILPMVLVIVYLAREEITRFLPASSVLLSGEVAPWLPFPILAVVAGAYVLYALVAWGGARHVKSLPRDFANAGLIFAIPLSAVAAASAFAWLLARLKGPDVVASWIGDFAGPNALVIMFLLVALFVIVGDFIDAVPAIIIFLPIIRALTELGGIHPVHMGVTIVVTLAFGLITPPYGISLLMASKFVDVSFGRAVIRSLPFYLVFFIAILFCIFFPEVVLWLPKKLLPESVGCFKAPDGGGYICPKISTLFRG